MLYALFGTIKAATEPDTIDVVTGEKKDNFESSRNTKKVAGDVKLFETIFESLPQLLIQLIVVMHYKQCVSPVVAYASLAITIVSITLALGSKFGHVYDLSDNAFEEVFVALYFAADTISRSVALSMVFGAYVFGVVFRCVALICFVQLLLFMFVFFSVLLLSP